MDSLREILFIFDVVVMVPLLERLTLELDCHVFSARRWLRCQLQLAISVELADLTGFE
jgi:hypothetical protein